MREASLEAAILALLEEGRDLEALFQALRPRFPHLTRARLFGLLVRMRRRGLLAYRQGLFLPGEGEAHHP
ncbi:hypothetical protein [Thermus sp.]|uniref:hypothetical protein n=1 Tax=Thermus sp. TaxID=275 RepID=UPI00307D7DB3